MADAEDRGWGPGWPTGVPPSQLTQVDITGTRFPGGVRTEIARLVELLVAECKARGYVFGANGDPAYGCWGYSNRPISGTQTPSNHSWGLAVDVNAPTNPQKRPLTTDMPAWMPDLWKGYTFDWGGDYQTSTPDPMHFEYMGTPAQAAADTTRAEHDLGQPAPPDPPGGDEDMCDYLIVYAKGGAWIVHASLTEPPRLIQDAGTLDNLKRSGQYREAAMAESDFEALPSK
jgi:D-alanyl-D-alanine carboxypeptidase